ncbi:MAG: peptide chain release factor N(5)-glutamine methyltransferase [Betaproteobacteria bacterium]
MLITVQAALIQARQRVAPLDARVLLRHVLQCSDAFIIAHADESLTQAEATVFESLIQRRVKGEPVAYLTGVREFYGRDFTVTADVLIPRPDTELLVSLALERLPFAGTVGHPSILELGCGSGCVVLSIALEREGLEAWGLDLSAEALVVARGNALRLKAPSVQWLKSDWFEALPTIRFDVVLSNPPYIQKEDGHLQQGDLRFEPRLALVAEDGGWACLEKIIQRAATHLKPQGWLLLEHGFEQARGCRERLQASGFRKVQSWTDLAGIERVSGGQCPV